MIQYEQFKGMADRAASVLAGLLLARLVAKGYLGESDAAALLPFLVLLPSLAWGWWVNRNKGLLQSAANVVGEDGKKTVIAASPELAAATPDNRNIISNTAPPAVIAAAVESAKTGEK